jgi:tungstate transport system ATP-binding protein
VVDGATAVGPSAPAGRQPGDAPLVSLRGATVRYGRTVALHPIDLDVYAGDTLALTGPNGSGKSTLLRLLHGLVPCASGERRLAARPGHGGPPLVSMVFPRPFLVDLSVRANLLIALWLRGVPAAQRGPRVDAALERIGLQALARQPARALSTGQQQRLAMVRAWVVRPDLLLLDEPTAHLDATSQHDVESLLSSFATEGTALVLATHDVDQAKRLARRHLRLDRGRIVMAEATGHGTPADQRSTDPRVAR